MRLFPGALLPARQALMVALASGLVSACVVPRGELALAPVSLTKLGVASQAGPASQTPSTPAIAPDWWHALGDPQLDRLIADALADNPTLSLAQARLAAASASLGKAQSSRLPHADADASVERERFSADYIYPPPFGGGSYWSSEAQANLGWSLDLAGRQRALVNAAGARASAAAYDVAAARVALSGAMAQAYVAYANAETQLALAGEGLGTRQEWLKLTHARLSAGLAGDGELRAAEAALAKARQAQDRARGERAMALHLLAALAGQGPDYAASITPPTLRIETALPVPARLTADLLGQRADILAARARIEASAAERRASRAAFYPDIDLSAFIGLQALGLSALTHGSAETLGAGPALHLPIFEGGALAADYRGATAQNDAAIAAYNQAVVQGVREACDALSALDTATSEAARQREIVAGMAASLSLSDARARSGLAARPELVTASEALLVARQAMADIATQEATRRIQLLVALGGGFSSASPSSQSSSGASLASTSPLLPAPSAQSSQP